jgi:linoleoyl-CoA desaturase
MPKVTFNNRPNPFFSTLKDKVDNYFLEHKLRTSGNRMLYLKGGVLIFTAIAFYVILVFFTPHPLISILLCMLLAVNLALIGFNIMHEGGHQCFSKYAWINKISAYFLNILGGNAYFWKIKHNIDHHTYTNIEGMDSDIDVKPFLRLHEGQPWYWPHRYQHYYCFVLYGLSSFLWIFLVDFIKYFSGNFAPGYAQRLSLKEHVIFLSTKLFYVYIYMVLPLAMLGLVKFLIGYVIISFVFGLTLSIVFQLAHVVEATEFPKTSEFPSRIEQEWAIHQINSTANFAIDNKVLSWFLGGLNFQIEHHLFPRISHIHYPKISEFVKQTCRQFDVPYHEYPTMTQAIKSHFSHLKKMGRGNA